MRGATWLVVLVLCVANSLCQVEKVPEKNITFINDMLDLFNLKRTIALWPEIMQENLIQNANCTDELQEYFRGLEEQRIWALKSE